uniref:Family with sequence similarity 162 member A n=1 Tax=Falco tinnunculus TaxID=100819 RepID=A0A8C4UAN7_FALTI
VMVGLESVMCMSTGIASRQYTWGRSPLRVPGHKPTDWEKRFLLWAGHFKKPEDIPETVSIETIRAAKTTLRVKCSYVMIALTILGCIVMVIRGKQVRSEERFLHTEAKLKPLSSASLKVKECEYNLCILLPCYFG